MFRCKVCAEKDERIKDLQKQVEAFRSLVLAPQLSPYSEMSLREANIVLDGGDELLEVPNPTDREMAALLTGNYDNAQVDFE